MRLTPSRRPAGSPLRSRWCRRVTARLIRPSRRSPLLLRSKPRASLPVRCVNVTCPSAEGLSNGVGGRIRLVTLDRTAVPGSLLCAVVVGVPRGSLRVGELAASPHRGTPGCPLMPAGRVHYSWRQVSEHCSEAAIGLLRGTEKSRTTGLFSCARVDSNHHGENSPQGPQPCASTNSATSAGGRSIAPDRRPPGRRSACGCVRPGRALQCEHMFVARPSASERGATEQWT